MEKNELPKINGNIVWHSAKEKPKDIKDYIVAIRFADGRRTSVDFARYTNNAYETDDDETSFGYFDFCYTDGDSFIPIKEFFNEKREVYAWAEMPEPPELEAMNK